MKSVFFTRHTKELLFLLSILLLGYTPLQAQAPSTESSPRNLIYMIGDGMGLSHVAMLLIEEPGRESAFEQMENVALITTHSANNRVTDSAAAGTALASGHKTDNSKLGVNSEEQPLASIISRAIEKGMHGGVVVTCEVQHATPGAFYAHTSHRGDYETISKQLAESSLDIVLGGGRSAMEQPDSTGKTPKERLQERGYRIVEQFEGLDSLDSGRLIGLFAEGHLPSILNGRQDYLPKATEKALQILTHNVATEGQGFVLMVEGSQIDFESHANSAEGILAEIRDFAQAISVAMRYVDQHPETLLVVTADHETGGLTIPSCESDFTQSEGGIEYRFSTGSHTGIPVPVYLYGCGAEEVNGILDNTELAQKMLELFHLQ